MIPLRRICNEKEEEAKGTQITGIKRIRGIESDKRSYEIIGAAMEVHRQLGSGFLESVYQQALALEFDLIGIPFLKEFPLPVIYKGHEIGKFRTDFLCFGAIIVEIKATTALTQTDQSQLVHYLIAAAKEIGLLINFGSASLEYRRIISPRLKPGLIPLIPLILLIPLICVALASLPQSTIAMKLANPAPYPQSLYTPAQQTH